MRALRRLWLYLRSRWYERRAVAAAEKALQEQARAGLFRGRATKFSSRLAALSREGER